MSAIQEVFEVNEILDDSVCQGRRLFLVSWKDTETSEPLLYRPYTKEMKSVRKRRKTFKIVWKPTWMTFEELTEGAAEALGAYLLLKLYSYKH